MLDINYKNYPVLIVDDDQSLLISLKASLKKEFFPLTANNAKEVWETLEKENVAVVLSDMRMPDITGAKLLAQIKEKYPKIVRVLITGYADLEDAVMAINEGKIFSYIRKKTTESERNLLIKRAIEYFHLEVDNERLREKIKYQEQFIGFHHIMKYMGDYVINRLVEASSAMTKYIDEINDLKEKVPELKKHVNDYEILSDSPKTIETIIKASAITITEVGYKLYITGQEKTEGQEAIEKLIGYIRESMQPEFDEAKVKLTYENPSNVAFTINSPTHLNFAITELLTNALRNTNKGGEVKLSIKEETSGDKKFGVITVSDNGVGITKENQPKLFKEPFTTDVNRPGVGLMSVAQITRIYEGESSIESEEGKGTRVTLKIPLS